MITTLAPGADEARVGHRVALAALVRERQVLHREVDTRQLAARYGQVAGRAGAARQHDRVAVLPELGQPRCASHVGVRPEGDAGLLHDGQAPIEDALLHLELGDAVAHETADAIGALEDGHPVAGTIELLGGGQPGRPRADHGDLLAGAHGGRLGHHPAFVEAALGDRDLDGLDGDGVVVDPEDAGALARRRAQPPGELGEVVGGVQAVEGIPPVLAVHEVVPVRDDVAERAALVAERNAAVHAPGRLLLQLVAREREVDLLPVAQALVDRTGRPLLALDLEKAGDLAHGYPLVAPTSSANVGSRPSARARASARSTRL
jgi:hypothetical protein